MDAAYFFQIMGTTGSLIMCASAFPQIIKTYKKKSVDSISGSYLAILITGMLFILSYALYKKDIIFILGNALSISLTGILMIMWFMYRKK